MEISSVKIKGTILPIWHCVFNFVVNHISWNEIFCSNYSSLIHISSSSSVEVDKFHSEIILKLQEIVEIVL